MDKYYLFRHKKGQSCLLLEYNVPNRITTNLHVQMNYTPTVDVLHAFADLFHEDGARFLGQHKVVVYDPLKQLTTLDSAKIKNKK